MASSDNGLEVGLWQAFQIATMGVLDEVQKRRLSKTLNFIKPIMNSHACSIALRRFGYWPADGFEWYVNCETAVPVKQRKLYIEFSGHEEDLPTFYRIIESVVVSDSQRN